MLYRIKAGKSEWYLVRLTLDAVTTTVNRLANDFPAGQEFQIFSRGMLTATKYPRPAHVKRRTHQTPELVLGPLPVDTINNTMDTELEPGEVVFSRAAQVHAARRHPVEYPVCLPHLATVVADPLYIGDDHKNPGVIAHPY
jgi:hypothetical protein